MTTHKHDLPSIHLLVDSLPDFVNVKDGDGRWIQANSVALDVFNIPHDADYIGKRDSELTVYSPFFKDAFLYCEQTDEEVWSGGVTVRGEEIIPQPDGSVRVFDAVKIPFFNEDGSRRVLFVIGRDISEHDKARHALQDKKERYKSLLQNNPNAVFSFDIERNFTSMSTKMEELCGYRADELIGKPTSILVADESLELFHSALQGQHQSIEFDINAKNGEKIPVEVHDMPIRVNGQIIVVLRRCK